MRPQGADVPRAEADANPAPARPGRRGRDEARDTPEGWLNLRNLVPAALLLALAAATGRKLLQAWQARRAANRLTGPEITPDEVRDVARHGRAALAELFGLLDEARPRPLREAAGTALARLWADDQLIAEEEKALVTRGFDVTWHARRRYPRGLRRPIPVAVHFGVPLLGDAREKLEWSVRLRGAGRADLERFTPWTPGLDAVTFAIEPGDFAGDGPHAVAFQARVRTSGTTSTWELDLPQAAYRFELDGRLDVDSILTLPDATRAEQIARAVRLESTCLIGDMINSADEDASAREPVVVPLNAAMALLDPPELVIDPLPCDLAHTVAVEFEGVPERFPAGTLIVVSGASTRRAFPSIEGVPVDLFERPCATRLRLVLTPDPHLGWTDPDVRSVWPAEVATDWAPVTIARR
jgi:hypothetical protein